MRLLFIGTTWPETDATAAGVRAWAMLEAMRTQGWQLAYVSPAKENRFTDRLRELGHLAASIPPNDPKFDELLAEFKPEIVIFDRFPTEEQFGWRVEKHSPTSLRVLDTVDLHFLRRAREDASARGMTIPQVMALLPQTEDMIRELSSIFRADLALICSSAELEILRKLNVPSSHQHHLPLLYPSPKSSPNFEERNHFVAIGNFRHPPNADAVHFLKREIWPLIRKELPTAELHIYGAYPSKAMLDLSQAKEGFLVKGSTEDQFATLSKYRVNLAPLRFGAGLKGKIADGWFTGMPCVSTSIGAEGMGEPSFGGMIANDPREFANAAIQLYRDETLWTRLATQGRETLTTEYSQNPQTERLIQRLEHALTELPARRSENLVGAMLWHHAHRSTEYFSRWIEAKNAR